MQIARPLMIIKKAAFYIIMLIWIGLCVSAFVDFLGKAERWGESEIGELFYYKMLILTFPFGYICALISAGVLEFINVVSKEFLEKHIISLWWHHSLVWLSMLFGGFLQWFVYLPRLFNQWC
jgi:hypothetical protein